MAERMAVGFFCEFNAEPMSRLDEFHQGTGGTHKLTHKNGVFIPSLIS
jgi:hypothetical protein